MTRFFVAIAILSLTAPGCIVAAQAGSGRAAVEGALAVSDARPSCEGGPVYVYFSATPLAEGERVTLEISLPDGVTALDGVELRRTFEHAAADTTLHLVAAVSVGDGSEKTITATATLGETDVDARRRTFRVLLNETAPAAAHGP